MAAPTTVVLTDEAPGEDFNLYRSATGSSVLVIDRTTGKAYYKPTSLGSWTSIATLTDNQLTTLTGLAQQPVLALPTPATPRFPYIAQALAIRAALLPAFATSAADESVSATRVTQMYYDPVRGNDSNSGASGYVPRKTLPTFFSTPNCKYYIAAGSVLNTLPTPTVSGVVVTVFDGDPDSPTYTEEILDQPNPYVRSLLGGWVTAVEKANKYFKVRRTDLNLSTASITTALFGHTAPGAGPCLVRGAWFAGGAMNCVYVNQASNQLRLEDAVIDCEVFPDAMLRGDKQADVGLRIGATPPSAPCSVARVFFGAIGTDQIYSYNTEDSNAPTVSDCAFDHTAPALKYRSQHSDVIQFGPSPGRFVIRRCVVNHQLNVAPVVIDDGSDKTTPVGTFFIASSLGGPGPDTPGGLIEDCVLMSNCQVHNVQFQTGITYNRCIGLLTPSPFAQGALLNWFAQGVETDCVWAVVDGSKGGKVRYGSGGSIRTRVTEVTY